ncbi:hypothetical protein LTR22_023178 [Elasticomyces elasticus]|nr:hypothetical protein LTR22_023178 [Elasticomyces elasticus]KAK4911422.1 hypothetical protein LTR49_019994 [Elasticomyces elasticus]KAK5755715.1 hypothetical protein LTS12_014177 [Elasticomyces elasticus]
MVALFPGYFREEMGVVMGLGAVGGDEGLEVVTKDEIKRIRVDAARETIGLLKRGYVTQDDVLAKIAEGGAVSSDSGSGGGGMVDAGTTTTDDLRVVRSIEVATSPVRSDGGDGIEWVEMSSVMSSVHDMERSSVWSSGMEEDGEYGGEWEGGETLVEMPDEEAEDEMEDEMEE